MFTAQIQPLDATGEHRFIGNGITCGIDVVEVVRRPRSYAIGDGHPPQRTGSDSSPIRGRPRLGSLQRTRPLDEYSSPRTSDRTTRRHSDDGAHLVKTGRLRFPPSGPFPKAQTQNKGRHHHPSTGHRESERPPQSQTTARLSGSSLTRSSQQVARCALVQISRPTSGDHRGEQRAPAYCFGRLSEGVVPAAILKDLGLGVSC